MIDDFTDDIFSDPFFSQDAVFFLVKKTTNERGQPESVKNRTELNCIIQPASKDDLATLPEGDRFNPVIRVMTQEPLNTSDEVIYQCCRWKIINDSIWSKYGYYDTLAIRYEGSQTDDSDGFIIT